MSKADWTRQWEIDQLNLGLLWPSCRSTLAAGYVVFPCCLCLFWRLVKPKGETHTYILLLLPYHLEA